MSAGGVRGVRVSFSLHSRAQDNLLDSGGMLLAPGLRPMLRGAEAHFG